MFNVEQGIHDVVSVAARALPNTYGAVECCYVDCCCARAAAVLPQEAKSEIASQARMALLMPRSSAAAAARPRADVIIHVKAKAGFKEVGQPDDKDKAASDSYYTLSATPLCTIQWIRMESASKASGRLCFTLRTATVSWRRVESLLSVAGCLSCRSLPTATWTRCRSWPSSAAQVSDHARSECWTGCLHMVNAACLWVTALHQVRIMWQWICSVCPRGCR